MGETLFNAAVMLASFAALVLIAWLSFRDLRSFGDAKPTPMRSGPSPTTWDPEPTEAPEPEAFDHRLRVEYIRNGRVERTQWIGDRQPGYVGTEAMPGMGRGVLVRHVRLSYDGDGFVMENRHGSEPLEYSRNGGEDEELAPGEAAPLNGEAELYLGEWTVLCREE